MSISEREDHDDDLSKYYHMSYYDSTTRCITIRIIFDRDLHCRVMMSVRVSSITEAVPESVGLTTVESRG